MKNKIKFIANKAWHPFSVAIAWVAKYEEEITWTFLAGVGLAIAGLIIHIADRFIQPMMPPPSAEIYYALAALVSVFIILSAKFWFEKLRYI